jgi:hypothetical protein
MRFFELRDTETLLSTFGLILQKTSIYQMQQMISTPRIPDPDLIFEIVVTMNIPFASRNPVEISPGINGALWNVKSDDDLSDITERLAQISQQISGTMLDGADNNIGVKVNLNPVRLDPQISHEKWSEIVLIIQGKLPQMEIEDISSNVTRCLDSHKINEDPEPSDESNCSICLEDFEQTNGNITSSIKIPCKHIFHYQCLAQWMIEQSKTNSLTKSSTNIMATCPICRFQLLGEVQEEAGDEDEEKPEEEAFPQMNSID